MFVYEMCRALRSASAVCSCSQLRRQSGMCVFKDFAMKVYGGSEMTFLSFILIGGGWVVSHSRGLPVFSFPLMDKFLFLEE